MGRRTGVDVEIDATTSELEVLVASETQEGEKEDEGEGKENIYDGRSATRMESRHPRKNRLRSIIGICLFLALTGIIYLGYFCPDHVCALTNREIRESIGLSESLSIAPGSPVAGSAALSSVSIELDRNGLLSVHPAFKLQSIQGSLGYDDIFANDTFQFDINAHDVMVFLHIQKTGGTLFGKHLVRDLELQRPCSCQRRRKRCFCFRPNHNENWLFSRYSTGWKCGLHADWTELTNCVDTELNKIEGDGIKRRYFYITIIRDPVARYLSEFRHVQRGATWRGARHWCGGTQANIPQCYDGPNWKGVTLEEFMECPYNLARNRQTRMLADLSIVGCYNSTLSKTDKERLILASAKHNLQFMPFFMLTEYQKVGQYTFEETFKMRFAVAFEQHNATLSAATMATLSTEQLDAVRKLNSLDLELYEFAKNLAFQRFKRLRDRDPHFVQRFQHLGELPSRQSATEFNWDSVIEDTTDNE
ncbi:PREDICTED: heparan-sulfate 6-O-sulfotransferase 1 [Trachymyrmex cornetzi]|uniref:heparan-sulfate 6-O-sulfotransferase 1 n=1 Tax=Trachymyrmex cornetzi TaxID=471704 RepID=UPI00084F5BC3|nr:PREDICTED: heparan-sulfate 6-O-sulfotransferase 1 [Trachymyrmex cornetzi]XP_018359027.1 PREDICTED: heparan-sulfate 6-O-sulfotransferase 1 [Trachymyrmex cornetzi]XP_018359028.1 PREDICTED: heparan-sulfate 6-O-sulfotransferase 1 [Trachymyrmex cornetzi]XP_018359029.1 PREDICTED: heparan-sulfate 6-O-sulfotransferase 1 [Trachymyrmex cornetzi]